MDCLLWATVKAKIRRGNDEEELVESDEEQSFLEDESYKKRKRTNCALCVYTKDWTTPAMHRQRRTTSHKTPLKGAKVSPISAANKATS